MVCLATLIFWTLVALVAVQAVLVWGFDWVLRRPSATAESAPLPKVAAILCLRGPDPFLRDCIRALLNQDYPDYQVRIVVDSPDDPAWSIASETLSAAAAQHAELMPLRQRRSTCGLKCSSLLEAMESLDDSFEVAALLDADAVPHPRWLRDLVAPLADPRVGATTGNRWYMPQAAGWGALVRYFWNVAAIVQMYWFGIAWGGSLAFKLNLLRESDLLDRWSRALCEDTMLFGVLRRHKLRIQFVPALIMINRETCTLGGFFSWVRRQLLTARLYHPRWGAVVGHGVLTSLALVAATVVIGIGWAQDQSQAVAWAGGGLVLYLAAMLALAVELELAVRHVVRRRGESTAWLNLKTALQMLVALPLTQIVYPAALASSLFLRQVTWRGVRYQVRGPWEIRVEDDRPFESQSEEACASL